MHVDMVDRDFPADLGFQVQQRILVWVTSDDRVGGTRLGTRTEKHPGRGPEEDLGDPHPPARPHDGCGALGHAPAEDLVAIRATVREVLIRGLHRGA